MVLRYLGAAFLVTAGKKAIDEKNVCTDSFLCQEDYKQKNTAKIRITIPVSAFYISFVEHYALQKWLFQTML